MHGSRIVTVPATLLPDEETTEITERMIAWLVALAARGAPLLLGHDQATWLARFSGEHDNFRDALDRATPVDRLTLAVDLERFW